MDFLRSINLQYKLYKKRKAGTYLSPVRRIEHVYRIKSERWVAMTFDDGPSALVPEPARGIETGLTDHLTDVLHQYNAVGTFDVIGDTSDNYPDDQGERHSAQWGGKAHDHYPDYKQDHQGGIVHQSELGEKIASQHDFSNHGYRHVLFGPMPFVYGKRKYLPNIQAVVEDLLKLHNLVYDQYRKTLRLSRPPHYVDKIKGGHTSYDAYAYLGYHYMAASVDGGGWKATTGDYDRDVEIMVRPIQTMLERDADALNGHIIFQKDGFNMSHETPIAHALEPQLQLLKAYGYKVVSVNQLIKQSPFEDFGEGHKYFEMARNLDQRGYIVAYKNNTFQPDRLLTYGELVTMTTPRFIYEERLKLLTPIKRQDFESLIDIDSVIKEFVMVRQSHPYHFHFQYAKYMGYLNNIPRNVDINDKVTVGLLKTYLSNVAQINGRILPEIKKSDEGILKRYEALPYLEAVLS